jgi:hypothetical protein
MNDECEGGKIMPFAKPEAAPSRQFEKTQMETKLLSLDEMFRWKLPPFQREERQTQKVLEFAEELKCNGGMVSGTILLGMLRGQEDTVYLVDGQQRRHGCEISTMEEFIADISLKTYDSMADMAEDFKRANGRLVPFKPDDLLRAYEVTHVHLKQLHDDCPFIGYVNIRRNDDKGAVLSMSCALRCWFGSALVTPALQNQAVTLLDQLDESQRQCMTIFLRTAHNAWGTDRSYGRLWANLNLLMTMYLYRKLVLDPVPSARRVPLPIEMFRKCLMSVSADGSYSDWLQGRNVGERDRAPCYRRLKTIFAQRLLREYNGKIFKMPKPDWS